MNAKLVGETLIETNYLHSFKILSQKILINFKGKTKIVIS